ncbi:MAG TPA: hypothetical protein VJO12_04975 [Stellaceae bacterium]|nr:hypothetical protein [Stellaceae bacterium]
MIAGRAAVVAAMLGLLAPAGAAAEQVVVRATEHAKDHFGRIAFIWPAPVRYQARLDGTTLTVHFARPMTAKLDTIPKRLHRYVSSVRMRGGATVVARVTRGATLTSFTSGNTVAVDIALRHRRRADADDASDLSEIVPPPELIEPAGAPAESQQLAKDRAGPTN